MKIPKYARYGYCAEKACEFLEEFKINSYPIDVEKIIHKQKWGLTPYSLIMQEFNCDRDKVIKCLRSKDGYTQLDGTNYSIAFNDDSKLGNRTRFTLMHEIGHIYLKHLEDYDITLLYRGSLSKQENKVLENEANAFARNVLAPTSVLLQLKDKSITNVSNKFGISYEAAKIRLELFNIDAKNISTIGLTKRMANIFSLYFNKRTCTTCNASFNLVPGTFCPICGNKTLKWGDGKMIYPSMMTTDKGKLIECPVCHNTETFISGSYCQICGTQLQNFCTNSNFDYQCPVGMLPVNARYCPECGEPSSFYKNGILQAWNYNENNSFMTIPDGIDEELPFN